MPHSACGRGARECGRAPQRRRCARVGTHSGTTAEPQAVRATTRERAQQCSALATAVMPVSIMFSLLQ